MTDRFYTGFNTRKAQMFARKTFRPGRGSYPCAAGGDLKHWAAESFSLYVSMDGADIKG